MTLALYREAMKGEHGGDKKSDAAINANNVTIDRRVSGNSRAYSIARDLLRRYLSGWGNPVTPCRSRSTVGTGVSKSKLTLST